MNDYLLPIPGSRGKSRIRYGLPARNSESDGFRCMHCHAYATAHHALSGVENRNHCPFCLWSRHLDLYAAGDRLSACKAQMQPVGLTIKAAHKKYGTARGELMLIHVCSECEKLSINRIAADDDPQTAFGVFESSFQLDASLKNRLEASNINAFTRTERKHVRIQLFGQASDIAEVLFKSCMFESV